MKRIRLVAGYPSKKYIKYLLGIYNSRLIKDGESIMVNCVIFSAMYAEGIKGTGILWKNTKSMKHMDGFMDLMIERGVSVKTFKNHGQVHSVWFACQLDEK